jgi:hypothetical protein
VVVKADVVFGEGVAVYAQVIHELRTELDRRTDNTTQRSPVRSLPTSIT